MTVEHKPHKFASRTWPWVILLIILAVAPLFVVANMPTHKDSRRDRTIAEISNLKSALDAFENDNGRYPTTSEGLAALMTRPGNVPAATWKKYMEEEPCDHWGHPYQYQGPDILGKGNFNIISAGEVGKLGTPDDIDKNTRH